MLDTAYINGVAVSWAHIKFRVSVPSAGNQGGRLYGFHSFDFGGEKLDIEDVYGQDESQAPIAQTQGEYVPPRPKVGFLAHTLDADETAPYESLITLLSRAAPDGRSYGLVRMYWLLQISAPVMRAKYEFFDVRLIEPGGSWSKGPEGLRREVGFACLRHRVNGKSLCNSVAER